MLHICRLYAYHSSALHTCYLHTRGARHLRPPQTAPCTRPRPHTSAPHTCRLYTRASFFVDRLTTRPERRPLSGCSLGGTPRAARHGSRPCTFSTWQAWIAGVKHGGV
eukprot:365987-Chlamydomonas_euryale.AAC.12